jgi:hypothetical protein
MGSVASFAYLDYYFQNSQYTKRELYVFGKKQEIQFNFDILTNQNFYFEQ